MNRIRSRGDDTLRRSVVASRAVYYLALAVLAVNILLTVTDQSGLLDLLTLSFDLALLVLLLARRPGYLPVR